MQNLVFTSVAFGQAYLDQQTRLKASILSFFPDALINFYYGTMPPGARPMNTSLYGFKPHAVVESMKLAERVVWLDPAMILVDSNLSAMLCRPVVAVRDDHKLNPFCSDQCVKYYNETRESLKDVHLVGGSLYYFDTRFQVAMDVINSWLAAEKANMFGGESQVHTGAERGHRNDETNMALSMNMYNIQSQWGPEVRYCNEHSPMWIKKHFK